MKDPQQIDNFIAALEGAEAVLIGAGAGLSASAGFLYSGKRFRENFADFEARYGFHDMYSGGFYPFETAEEYWAYWSRYILLNRYSDPPKPVYDDLFRLVSEREYFVLTTNVDHCFQKAGFQKERLFYTQGDFGLFQCSRPCCEKTYDNETAIRNMVAMQRDMKIPSSLIPRCPKCGAPMTTNLRVDDRFAEDEGWHSACRRYEDFLEKHRKSALLLLELGVGGNTPAIIKYPFWKLAENERAVYVCINRDEAYCPPQIAHSICIDEDIGTVLSAVLTDRQ